MFGIRHINEDLKNGVIKVGSVVGEESLSRAKRAKHLFIDKPC